jgi:putative hydrolase of the HAD superfamily
MSIRVVCFDLGGVLLQINHEWQGAASCAGVACGNGSAGRLVDFKPIDVYQGGGIPFSQYLDELAVYLQVADAREAEAVHMAILREEYPGVPELIAELNEAGLVTGILSNTSGPHWERMHRADLFPGFNLVQVPVASHEVAINKPDPAIYQAFMDAVPARADEIVFFDDYEANIVGAKAMGWEAFQIDSSGDTVAQVRGHLRDLGIL